jgi:hypothetical protein
MRAGLIIGGLFLMFVGGILFYTIIFTLFGILCGVIGFIMLIVGLVTLSKPSQVTTTVYTPAYTPPVYAPPVYPQPPPVTSTYQGVKYCTACGTPSPKENQYCGKCGKRFLE